MPAVILRSHPWKQLKMLADTALTVVVDVGGMERGMVFVPLNWGTADIAFLAAYESDAYRLAEDTAQAATTVPAFALLRDETGAVVKMTGLVPGCWHLIPTRALAMKYLQLQSTNVGLTVSTPTNQAEDCDLILAMKS